MEELNHIAKASLGIRKPVNTVFEALINPEITTKFWFTHGSGKMGKDATLEWKWEMFDVHVPVNVTTFEPNKKIVFEWGEKTQFSTVKWEFKSINENLTFLTITNYNFQGKGDELIGQIRDSTKGFTFLLAGLKAWLEHRIQLRLVEDSFPKEMMG